MCKLKTLPFRCCGQDGGNHFFSQKLGSQRTFIRLRSGLSLHAWRWDGCGGVRPPGGENIVPPTHPWNEINGGQRSSTDHSRPRNFFVKQNQLWTLHLEKGWVLFVEVVCYQGRFPFNTSSLPREHTSSGDAVVEDQRKEGSVEKRTPVGQTTTTRTQADRQEDGGIPPVNLLQIKAYH